MSAGPGTVGQPPVVIFDGVCNVCNASARFIVRHDARGLFRFAHMQGELGARLMRKHGVSPDTETVVLVRDGEQYLYSTAALEIARDLDPPWRWLYVLRFVPVPIRDGCYRLFGRHRYRLFGRTEACTLPAPGLRERFIDRLDSTVVDQK